MTFDPNDPVASGLTLTFSDEFATYDAAPAHAGGTKWSNTTWWQGGQGGSGLELVDPDLSYVEDGNLVLECTKVGDQWWCGYLVSYIGNTQGGTGFHQKYGYFEARLKAPAGQGTWGAWWMLAKEWLDTNDSGVMEIDILETDGNAAHAAKSFSVLHNDWMKVAHQFRMSETILGEPISDNFHRYGMLWSPYETHLHIYIDGVKVDSIRKFPDTDRSTMFLIVGNQIGSLHGGFQEPTGSTFMYVDYVRVWGFPPTVTRYFTSEASAIACGPGTRRELGLDVVPPPPPPPPPDSFSLAFDGVDDRADVPHHADLSPGSSEDFTLLVRVRTTQTIQGGNWPIIVSKETSNAGYSIILHNSSNHSNWYCWNLVGGSGSSMIGTTNITDGEWHTLAMQRSGSTLEAWRNGSLENSGTRTSGSLANTEVLRFGHYPGLPEWAGFEGEIAWAAFYNRTLTSQEHADAHAGNLPTSGLVSHWPMNEGTGDNFEDVAGDHDGTIFGATWTPL